MSNAANPYAPPAARVDDSAGANPEAEAIRQAHIGHEASIKSIGILYYLGGGMLLIVAVTSLFTTQAEFGSTGVALVLGALGAAYFAAAWGVRALRKWGQILVGVLSVLGLFGFPIGTLVSLYILYLLLSKKGRTIFSPEYRDIVAATPHVKYRTSILMWILLALVVALLVAAVAVPMFVK